MRMHSQRRPRKMAAAAMQRTVRSHRTDAVGHRAWRSRACAGLAHRTATAPADTLNEPKQDKNVLYVGHIFTCETSVHPFVQKTRTDRRRCAGSWIHCHSLCRYKSVIFGDFPQITADHFFPSRRPCGRLEYRITTRKGHDCSNADAIQHHALRLPPRCLPVQPAERLVAAHANGAAGAAACCPLVCCSGPSPQASCFHE